MILSTNFSEVFLLIPKTSKADNASSLAVLLFWKEIKHQYRIFLRLYL